MRRLRDNSFTHCLGTERPATLNCQPAADLRQYAQTEVLTSLPNASTGVSLTHLSSYLDGTPIPMTKQLMGLDLGPAAPLYVRSGRPIPPARKMPLRSRYEKAFME